MHNEFLQISFQDLTVTFEFVFKHDSFLISLIRWVNTEMSDKFFIIFHESNIISFDQFYEYFSAWAIMIKLIYKNI
jgi:hypothetical protein